MFVGSHASISERSEFLYGQVFHWVIHSRFHRNCGPCGANPSRARVFSTMGGSFLPLPHASLPAPGCSCCSVRVSCDGGSARTWDSTGPLCLSIFRPRAGDTRCHQTPTAELFSVLPRLVDHGFEEGLPEVLLRKGTILSNISFAGHPPGGLARNSLECLHCSTAVIRAILQIIRNRHCNTSLPHPSSSRLPSLHPLFSPPHADTSAPAADTTSLPPLLPALPSSLHPV